MNKFLKYIIVAFLAANYKLVPGAYYVRFYWSCLNYLILPRFKRTFPLINSHGVGTKPLDLYRPSVYKLRCSLWEVDMYLHKGNSTYFTDLDMARTRLLGQQLQVFMNKCEINHDGDYPSKSVRNWPWFPVASVEAIFLREIKPLQQYEIHSRILAWDEKWLFIISQFVSFKTDKRTGNRVRVIHTVCVTRYVLKNGRKTVKPETAFRSAGLWNDDVERLNREVYYPLVSGRLNSDALCQMDLSTAGPLPLDG